MATETIDVVQTYVGKSTDPVPALGSASIILVECPPGETPAQALAAAAVEGSTRRRFTASSQYTNLRLKAAGDTTPTADLTPDANGWVNYDTTNTLRTGYLMWLQGDNVRGSISPEDLAMLEASQRGGANYVHVVLCWYNTEKRGAPGQYNWTELLDVMRHAKRLKMQVFIRWAYDRQINVEDQYSTNDDNFIPAAEAQADDTGAVHTALGTICASFDSDLVYARIYRWIRAGMTAIQGSGYAGQLIGGSPAPNAGIETEYPRGNGGSDARRTFDYSAPALAKFVRRAQGWYGTLAVANNRWGTEFTGWDKVRLPVPAFDGDRVPNFNTRFLRDFYYHREQSLIERTNEFAALIKGFSANLKTMAEPGNLADNLAINRGTLTYAPLLNVDMIGNNNQLNMDYFLSAALALRNRQNKGAKDEIEWHYTSTESAMVDWFVSSWRAGVRMFDLFGFRKGDGVMTYERAVELGVARIERYLKAALAAVAAQTPRSPATTTKELVISGDALLAAVNPNNSGDSGRFAALSAGGQNPVKVTITPLTRPA